MRQRRGEAESIDGNFINGLLVASWHVRRRELENAGGDAIAWLEEYRRNNQPARPGNHHRMAAALSCHQARNNQAAPASLSLRLENTSSRSAILPA